MSYACYAAWALILVGALRFGGAIGTRIWALL
jgi:hypothetical protein